MGRLADQIREAIRDCGTTNYVLAQQVGVSESALSRFMAGKSGLNLSTLDKLADVIGFEIVITFQRVQKPRPKGRQPKDRQMETIKNRAHAKALAEFYAKDANENYFSSRRGTWYLADIGKVCMYNNNPYAVDATLRDKETKVFLKHLRSLGIDCLAQASYPPAGSESAGYTYALILNAGEADLDKIAKAFQETFDSFTRPKLDALVAQGRES